jgi:hypothetical protein
VIVFPPPDVFGAAFTVEFELVVAGTPVGEFRTKYGTSV